MPRKIFVNFVVSDLEKAKAFYAGLGFTFNPMFTNHEAACMVVNEDAIFMVHTPDSMKRFTPKPAHDPNTHLGAMFGFSADTREDVDAIALKAAATGGKLIGEPQDHGFMYQRAFHDLDGHHWEILWLNAAALPPG